MLRSIRSLLPVALWLTTAGCDANSISGNEELAPVIHTATIEDGVYVVDWETNPPADHYVVHHTVDNGNGLEEREIEVAGPPVRLDLAFFEIETIGDGDAVVLHTRGHLVSLWVEAVVGEEDSEFVAIRYPFPDPHITLQRAIDESDPQQPAYGIIVRAPSAGLFDCPDPTQAAACMHNTESIRISYSGAASGEMSLTEPGDYFIETGPSGLLKVRAEGFNRFGNSGMSPELEITAPMQRR